MAVEQVTLPLTGSGDATADVAADLTPSGYAQVIKLAVSADGIITLLPADMDGLYVQAITRAEDPHDSILSSPNLGAGVSVNLDAAIITNLKTGRLYQVDVGASVPIRCDVQLVSPARVTRTIIYTREGESKTWRTPAQNFFELIGDGDNKFGVSITNLSVNKAADVQATIYWDEVA